MMLDQTVQNGYGCTCDSEKVIFCFDKRTGDYTWSCSGHCFEQVPSQTVGTQTEQSDTKENSAPNEKKKGRSSYRTKGTETDIYGVDKSDELSSILTDALDVCRKERTVVVSNSTSLAVTQYASSSEVIYCISGADDADLEPVAILDKPDGLIDDPSNEKYYLGQTNSQCTSDVNDKENTVDDDDNQNDGDGALDEDTDDSENSVADDDDLDEDPDSENNVAVTDKDDVTAVGHDCDEEEEDAVEDDANEDLSDVQDDYDDDDKDVDYVVDDSDAVDSDEDRPSGTKQSDSNSTSQAKAKMPKKSSADQIKITDQPSKRSYQKKPKKVFPCPHCDTISSCKSKHDRHVKTHTREQVEIKCDLCGRVFKKPSSFSAHMKKHEEEKNKTTESTSPKTKRSSKIDCSYCGKTFDKRRIDRHIRTHTHPRIKKVFTCSYCGKVIEGPSHFERHVRIHTKERPFECTQCGKTFAGKKDLNIHIRRHLGDKRHKCQFCGKAFVRKINLTDHLRTHTGARPYKCEYCDKSFGFRNVLKTHLLRHSGVRPHVCEYCNKGFTKKSFLDAHLITHTGEKPFKCLNCGESFMNKSSFTAHSQIHVPVGLEMDLGNPVTMVNPATMVLSDTVALGNL